MTELAQLESITVQDSDDELSINLPRTHHPRPTHSPNQARSVQSSQAGAHLGQAGSTPTRANESTSYSQTRNHYIHINHQYVLDLTLSDNSDDELGSLTSPQPHTAAPPFAAPANRHSDWNPKQASSHASTSRLTQALLTNSRPRISLKVGADAGVGAGDDGMDIGDGGNDGDTGRHHLGPKTQILIKQSPSQPSPYKSYSSKGKAREVPASYSLPGPASAAPRLTRTSLSRSTHQSAEPGRRPKRIATQVTKGHYDDRKRYRRLNSQPSTAPKPRPKKQQPSSGPGHDSEPDWDTIVVPPFRRRDHEFTPEKKLEFLSRQNTVKPNQRSLSGPLFPGEFEQVDDLIGYFQLYEEQQKRQNKGKVDKSLYTNAFEQMIKDVNQQELNGNARIRIVPQPSNLTNTSPPFEFIYTNRIVYSGKYLPVEPEGCACIGNCGEPPNFASCFCRKRQEMVYTSRRGGEKRSHAKGFAYDKNGM